MFLLLDTIYFSSDPPDSELFFLPPSSFFGAFANLRRERRKGKKNQKKKQMIVSIKWIVHPSRNDEFSATQRGGGGKPRKDTTQVRVRVEVGFDRIVSLPVHQSTRQRSGLPASSRTVRVGRI